MLKQVGCDLQVATMVHSTQDRGWAMPVLCTYCQTWAFGSLLLSLSWLVWNMLPGYFDATSDQITYNLKRNQVDLENPHTKIYDTTAFRCPRTCYMTGELTNTAMSLNLSVCLFMILARRLTESTGERRENIQGERTNQFLQMWGFRRQKGVGHCCCTPLLFRLSGMRANQIAPELFSPNPHHIISQHKPRWISGYWTSNQLSLAPL